MAVIETVGKCRRAHCANPQPSAASVRQNPGLLHVAHGQGCVRGTRPSSRLFFGHKRQSSSGKSSMSDVFVKQNKKYIYVKLYKLNDK